MSKQTNLFNFKEPIISNPFESYEFPSTRYQGSKLKLVDWIQAETKDLTFDTVLDAFGGTGSVSYLYKKMGKEVTYNDLLKFNYQFGKALIENKEVKLTDDDIRFVLNKNEGIEYKSIIEDDEHVPEDKRKRYTFVGCGCGITWLKYRKSKRAEEFAYLL